jgi:predicted kinase/ADP-ribose pyrophosphatase YjhB (NUDIX family)
MVDGPGKAKHWNGLILEKSGQDEGVGRRLIVVVTGLPGTGKSTVADVAAEQLGAAVLGHDWAMSGLRPYPRIQQVMDGMEPPGHRAIGWSILTALARAQLRAGRSVVLDGVARWPELAQCRAVARSEDARMVVIATWCSDREVHRSRIEGRLRLIPDWYEVDWEHVERALGDWEGPEEPDLTLDAAQRWDVNVSRLSAFFNASPAGAIPAFIVGCGNLISDNEGRYLLVQEAKPSAWSRYNLPAGKPEAGELLEGAAIREAKEETGLDVSASHLVGIYQCPMTSEGFGVVNFVFSSVVTGGELTPSDAHPIVKFFSKDEIADLFDRRLLRGHHIQLAIADHEQGVRFPLDLVRAVPEMNRQ